MIVVPPQRQMKLFDQYRKLLVKFTAVLAFQLFFSLIHTKKLNYWFSDLRQDKDSSEDKEDQ